MPLPENERLIAAFNRLGLSVMLYEDPDHDGHFVASLEQPSAAMKWDDVPKNLNFLGNDEHFSGYGETGEAALSGLRKRFRETARNDGVVVVRVTDPGRHMVIRSDGGDGARNIGGYQVENTDAGMRVQAIDLKR